MRWTPGEVSGNIEDRRGSGGGGFGGGGGMRVGLGGVVVAAVLSLIFGRDLVSPMLTGGGGEPPRSPEVEEARNRAEEPMVKFVSFVLDDTQNTWHQLLGSRYQDAKLVLFRDVVESACGMAESATGPFYCPADQKLYIDLGFYEELDRRFGAPGDFAQAYVLAHEVGHHVQTLLGISRKVRQSQQSNPSAAKALSVRMELQADCLAGVWGNSANKRGKLESGDVEEGLEAAAAVGDDRIQRRMRGHVSPESFTHGSSQQRMDWFRRGFNSGDIGACDTFATR